MANEFVVHECQLQLARQGMTVPQLAQLLEIDEPYLRSILRGEIAARPSFVPVLAQALGQDPKIWLFETEALPQINEIRALFPRQWAAYLVSLGVPTAQAQATAPGVAVGMTGVPG